MFTQKCHFKKHFASTHKGKKFFCIKCDIDFELKIQLKTHVDAVHGIDRCHEVDEVHKGHKEQSYCNKSFSQAETLKYHNHTVHKGHHKEYNCESCGKSFSCASTLKIHNGHKYYKCESCGKLFTTAQTLKKHIYSVHEGHKNLKLVVNPFLEWNI